MSRESSVHVMHRARMPPNFMVTIVLHGRLKIINPDGQGAGGRMAAELHSSCHWAAPAADPALEVWLFRAQPGGTGHCKVEVLAGPCCAGTCNCACECSARLLIPRLATVHSHLALWMARPRRFVLRRRWLGSWL